MAIQETSGGGMGCACTMTCSSLVCHLCTCPLYSLAPSQSPPVCIHYVLPTVCLLCPPSDSPSMSPRYVSSLYSKLFVH